MKNLSLFKETSKSKITFYLAKSCLRAYSWTVTQLLKKFCVFMEPEGSSPCSQKPIIAPTRSQTYISNVCRIHSDNIFYQCLGLPWHFLTKIDTWGHPAFVLYNFITWMIPNGGHTNVWGGLKEGFWNLESQKGLWKIHNFCSLTLNVWNLIGHKCTYRFCLNHYFVY